MEIGPSRVLKESKSGLNDEAFESERKKTAKFKVEHLQEDCDNVKVSNYIHVDDYPGNSNSD